MKWSQKQFKNRREIASRGTLIVQYICTIFKDVYEKYMKELNCTWKALTKKYRRTFWLASRKKLLQTKENEKLRAQFQEFFGE